MVVNISKYPKVSRLSVIYFCTELEMWRERYAPVGVVTVEGGVVVCVVCVVGDSVVNVVGVVVVSAIYNTHEFYNTQHQMWATRI
jgi:hypothetical protein